MHNIKIIFIIIKIFMLLIAVAVVQFNQSIYNISENDESIQPILILSSPLSRDITIQVKTNDSNATGK